MVELELHEIITAFNAISFSLSFDDEDSPFDGPQGKADAVILKRRLLNTMMDAGLIQNPN